MQTPIAALFTSGIAGGVINAVAGGATLITFPAMLAAGLPPIAANASNAVAISPGICWSPSRIKKNCPFWTVGCCGPLQ
jgi:uncharacterized membrane protein YfcA